jgi:hypothetical protein
MRLHPMFAAFIAFGLSLAGVNAEAQNAEKKDGKKGGERLSEKKVGLPERSPAMLAKKFESGTATDILIAKRDMLRWGKKEAGPALGIMLRSKKAQVRQGSLDLLTKMGGSDAAEQALMTLFESDGGEGLNSRDHNRQRREAARILGLMRSEQGLTSLLKALNNENWLRIRESARLALGLYGEKSLDTIIAYYEDAQAKKLDGVMARLLLVLGKIGGEKARLKLLEALQVEDHKYAVSMRHHAAIGLGTLADITTIDGLVERLSKEDDHYVQKYIARALVDITGQNFTPAPGQWRNWWRQVREEVLNKDKREREALKAVEVPLPMIPRRRKVKGPEKTAPEKAKNN